MQSSSPHSQSISPWSISCLLQQEIIFVSFKCITLTLLIGCPALWFGNLPSLLPNCKLPKERVWKAHLILACPVSPCLISCKSCCSVNICWINFTFYYTWIPFKLSWAVCEQVKVEVSGNYIWANVKYLHCQGEKKGLFCWDKSGWNKYQSGYDIWLYYSNFFNNI